MKTSPKAQSPETKVQPSGFEAVKVDVRSSKGEDVEKSYFPTYAAFIAEELKFPSVIVQTYLADLNKFLAGPEQDFEYVTSYLRPDGTITLYTIACQNGKDGVNYKEFTFTIIFDGPIAAAATGRILNQIHASLKDGTMANIGSLIEKIGKELNSVVLKATKDK